MNKKTIGEICDILSGYAFDSKLFTDNPNDMPLIRIRDIVRGYTETYTKEDYDSKYIVKNGDLLIGMDGEFNIAPWKGGDALLNQRVCKIWCSSQEVIDRYLLYFLPKALKSIEQATSYVTVRHLSIKTINNIQIPIPPIEIQQQVVKALDNVAELLELRKQQLSELDNLIQSIFYDMFGDPVRNEKGWRSEKLMNITKKIGSGATPRGGKESYKTEGISLIRSMNVHMGEFKYDQLAYIDDDQARQLDNVIVEENDVLINITGASIARSCIVPSDVIPARVNQHVSIIRLKDEIAISSYINYMFISNSFQTLLLSIGGAGGATREAITKQQLQELIIPLPPINLQTQFAKIVTKIEEQKTLVKEAIEDTQYLFDSLMSKHFDE